METQVQCNVCDIEVLCLSHINTHKDVGLVFNWFESAL